jgi:hypothetical protein
MEQISSRLLTVMFLMGSCVLPTRVFFSSSIKSFPIQFRLAPPSEVFDSSDLDARDALNRPIHNSATQQQFENLWIGSLQQMLARDWTPYRRQALAEINCPWSLAAGYWKRWNSDIVRILDAWCPLRLEHRLVQPSMDRSIFYPGAILSTTLNFSSLFFSSTLLMISKTRLLL